MERGKGVVYGRRRNDVGMIVFRGLANFYSARAQDGPQEMERNSAKAMSGPAVPGCCLVSFHILWVILSTSTVLANLQMVVGGDLGVGVGLLPDGVRLHNAGEGERPAQHVGAHQPPLQGEQRLAPDEQASIKGRE